MPKELIGQATLEQIKAWIVKYSEVNEIAVGGHVCYLKPMDRKTIGYALSQLDITVGDEAKMNLGQLVRIGEVAMLNCWIGGSEEIKKNDNLFVAASMKAGELLSFKEATLKKL